METRVGYDENVLVWNFNNSGDEVPVTDLNNIKVTDLLFVADMNNSGVLPATAPTVNGMPLYPGVPFSPDPKENEVIDSKFIVKVPTNGDLVYVWRKRKLR